MQMSVRASTSTSMNPYKLYMYAGLDGQGCHCANGTGGPLGRRLLCPKLFKNYAEISRERIWGPLWYSIGTGSPQYQCRPGVNHKWLISQDEVEEYRMCISSISVQSKYAYICFNFWSPHLQNCQYVHHLCHYSHDLWGFTLSRIIELTRNCNFSTEKTRKTGNF